MASPCELLLETADLKLGQRLGAVAASEAWRIEAKFSRYRSSSVVSAMNRSHGKPVSVDEETAALLQFSANAYRLSEGKFDITSGVLRRCWKFDGSDRLPAVSDIEALLPLIGFDKLTWAAPQITIPAGMEIDFGGIGKEYAVDRVLKLVTPLCACPVLVNFGGDLATNRCPRFGPWRVGVERPDSDREARLLLDLTQGALATSGDAHRFLMRAGVRYSHILDVYTGWPVLDAPRSVTVAAGSCVEAGMLATLAMLAGQGAEALLDEQGLPYWCLR